MATGDRGLKSGSVAPISSLHMSWRRTTTRKSPANADFSAETNSWVKLRECVAGAGGFEPPHGGIKIHCLTAWRRPNARLAPRSPCRRANHKARLAGLQLPGVSFPVRGDDYRMAKRLGPTIRAFAEITAKASAAPLLPQAGESIRLAVSSSGGNCRSVAQSGSVPCSERGGRRFESYHSDHQNPEIADEKPGPSPVFHYCGVIRPLRDVSAAARGSPNRVMRPRRTSARRHHSQA